MTHIFIVNPVSGSGRTADVYVPRIRAAAQKLGLPYDIHLTAGKKDVRIYVHERAAIGDPVRFYALGGDGTVNDVLNGMMGFENAELAVVPCGTGNDYSKCIEGDVDLTNIESLMLAETQLSDVIHYDDGYCINMFNIGVDCDICAEAARIKNKIIQGGFAYLLAAIKIIVQNRTYRMIYEKDGVLHDEELILCGIGNGRFCGGGFKSCPNASVTDGLMDVGVVKPVKTLRSLARLFPKYRNGSYLTDPEAEGLMDYFRCSHFKLIPVGNINICVDGEVTLCRELSFDVIPQAVRIAVPKGGHLV